MARNGEERNRVPCEVPGPLEARFSLGSFGGSWGQVYSYQQLWLVNTGDSRGRKDYSQMVGQLASYMVK